MQSLSKSLPKKDATRLPSSGAAANALARMVASKYVGRSLSLNFQVLHGRVLQVIEDKLPVVHGNGCTLDGWGRTRIRTDVVRAGEVWLRDHQTGRDHHFNLGSEYPPMLVGHDVSMLWVNGEHYATANHHTRAIETYFLSDAVGPYKAETNGWMAAVLALLIGPAVFFLALFALNAALPNAWSKFLHAIEPLHRWTQSEASGLCSTVIWWGVPISALVTWVCYLISKARARAHNARLDAELQDALDTAVDQHLRAYRLPGHGTRHLS